MQEEGRRSRESLIRFLVHLERDRQVGAVHPVIELVMRAAVSELHLGLEIMIMIHCLSPDTVKPTAFYPSPEIACV